MPSPVPTPVAAAIGIVPTVLDGMRSLPAKAVHLPVLALSTAVTGLDGARREYEMLARRGEELLAKLRGSSLDDLEDRVEDVLQGTSLAEPYDLVEDALEDAAEGVTALVRRVGARTRDAAGTATRTAAGGVDRAAGALDSVADEAQEVPEDEQPKGVPTPKAPEPDTTRIDTAASADIVETVERVSSTLGGEVLTHDQLPLPDYDHLTLGSLRGRMRSLDLPQLIQIRDYEKAHADRLPIVTMLDNRIAKLANDPTAPLGGGGPDAPEPAKAGAAQGGSKVSPATVGPATNPPSQGVPTNPAQPRT